jgi:Uma2 family endonuclease
MSSVPVASDLITFDVFCAIIPDGQKADLLDGVIYVASPDSSFANELASNLIALIRMYDGARKLGGKVYGGRFAFQLSEIDAPEPDVAYVTRRRLKLIDEGRMDGGPDVAIEIVTRDSHHRDYVLKRRKYEEARVREYWIVDAVKRTAQFLRLGGDKRYHTVRLENKRLFRSRVIPDFWLDVEWVTTGEFEPYDCLQQLLAE